MRAIFKREFRAYYTSPIGYVVMLALWLYSSLLFYMVFSSGSPDISSVFSSMFAMILFMIPLLTMRSFSEEKRQKTDQLYMTAPTSTLGVVLGKYLAAMAVFAIGLVLTVAFMFILCVYVTPDWLVYLGNLIGTMLLASSLIALGIFISSMTESQIVSAVVSYAVSLVLMLLDYIASLTGVDAIVTAAEWFSFTSRYESFTGGTFNWANMIFFLSLTGVFLFLTVRRLDRKRWA